MPDELLMLEGAREAVLQMMSKTEAFGKVTDFSVEVVSWDDIYQYLTGLIIDKKNEKKGENNND